MSLVGNVASWSEDPDISERRFELRRLAAACREAIDLMVATSASVDELRSITETLEAAVDALRGLPTGASYSGFSEAATAGAYVGQAVARGDDIDRTAPAESADESETVFFDFSPVMGLANPLAAPLTIRVVDDHVTGLVTFGSAYEGPPGCVHGGYIAAAFDELLGAAQSLSGHQGMTASLMVNYRSPTPLNAELRMKGSLLRIDGRKIFCEGWLWSGDRLCAQAEALFIALAPEKYQVLLAARQRAVASRLDS